MQFVVGPALALHVAMAAWSGADLGRRGLLADWLVGSLLGFVWICWQRRTRLALLSWFAALALLFCAAHAKLALLGDWPRWGDLALVPELLVVVPVATAVFLAGALGVATAGVANWRRRPGLSGLALGSTLLVAISLPLLVPTATLSAIDGLFPWRPWVGNDPFSRGLFVSLARDAAQSRLAERMLTDMVPLPLPEARPARRTRNLHMVVAESLTDPHDLGTGFPRARFDPRLARWSRGRALSPHPGGGSAQSEFELLCGLPATAALPDPVVFNGLGGAPVPCLPRRLAAVGYRSAASVAVEPWFFNARRAYLSLGFEIAYFSDDLPPGARRHRKHPTRELMRHNQRLVERWLAGRPFFNYVVTVEPHFPFVAAGSSPPLLLGAPQKRGLVVGLQEATRAIADHVQWLIERDPDALIVVVGDHQAPGLAPPPTSPSELLQRLGVPLAILDAGLPRAAGVVPHFELPELLVSLLEDSPPGTPRTSWLRPLRGGRVLQSRDSETIACPSEDSRCTAALARAAMLEARTRRVVAMGR